LLFCLTNSVPGKLARSSVTNIVELDPHAVTVVARATGVL